MHKFTSALVSFLLALAAADSQVLATDKNSEETILTLNLGNTVALASLTKIGTYV